MTANLKYDTPFLVLRLLHDKPDLTQREIADKLGISLGGVNHCLRGLADNDMIKIESFRNSKNKRGYLYLITPKGIVEKMAMTEAFLKRKMDEYEALRAVIEALEKERVAPGS